MEVKYPVVMHGIKKGDIQELKSFAKPPQLVADVMGITCMIVAGDNVSFFCYLSCGHSAWYMLFRFPHAPFYLFKVCTIPQSFFYYGITFLISP